MQGIFTHNEFRNSLEVVCQRWTHQILLEVCRARRASESAPFCPKCDPLNNAHDIMESIPINIPLWIPVKHSQNSLDIRSKTQSPSERERIKRPIRSSGALCWDGTVHGTKRVLERWSNREVWCLLSSGEIPPFGRKLGGRLAASWRSFFAIRTIVEVL